MTAVTIRHLVEVLLVVFLGVVERAPFGWSNLRCDGAVSPIDQHGCVGCRARIGKCSLCFGRPINRTAVLAADIISLAHALSRIVLLPEMPQEFGCGDLGGVVGHEHRFSVSGAPTADFFVRGVRGNSANGGGENAGDTPENLLGPPEAAHTEVDDLKAPGPRLIRNLAHRRAENRVVNGQQEWIVGSAGQWIAGSEGH